MAYTNRHTVKHKRKLINLKLLGKRELENLKRQITIDLADIENQISWAKSNLEVHGVQYNYDWMEKAVTASQIKERDIIKVNIYLDSAPSSASSEEEDLRELLTTVKDYMGGSLHPTVLDELIERLDKQYE